LPKSLSEILSTHRGIPCGLLFGLTLVAASTFLVYTNHPKMAGVLLGVNVLGFAGKLPGKSRRGEDQDLTLSHWIAQR
jgi:hypothetical protein